MNVISVRSEILICCWRKFNIILLVVWNPVLISIWNKEKFRLILRIDSVIKTVSNSVSLSLKVITVRYEVFIYLITLRVLNLYDCFLWVFSIDTELESFMLELLVLALLKSLLKVLLELTHRLISFGLVQGWLRHPCVGTVLRVWIRATLG